MLERGLVHDPTELLGLRTTARLVPETASFHGGNLGRVNAEGEGQATEWKSVAEEASAHRIKQLLLLEHDFLDYDFLVHDNRLDTVMRFSLRSIGWRSRPYHRRTAGHSWELLPSPPPLR